MLFHFIVSHFMNTDCTSTQRYDPRSRIIQPITVSDVTEEQDSYLRYYPPFTRQDFSHYGSGM